MTDQERLILPYPTDEHDDHDPDDLNNLGLQADAAMLGRSVMDRRRVLGLGVAGVGALLGTGLLGGLGAFGARAQSGAAGGAACTVIPPETAGPYPADGSVASGQALNVLTRSGIVRSDLRRSLGTGAVAAGVPLTLRLKLVNVNSRCAPLAGYAVYVWHCTANGQYSLYSPGVVGEDYLRGVQAAGPDGVVTFRTVFPGCYAGRWPHVHFEVYPTLGSATAARNRVQTSQLALPEAACRAAYATAGYGPSARNLSGTSLTRDMVFRDGYASQLAALTGSAGQGFTAALTVGLAR